MSLLGLTVSHLFNFNAALARLAFDDLFRGNARLAHLGIPDDQLHELHVIGTVIEK